MKAFFTFLIVGIGFAYGSEPITKEMAVTVLTKWARVNMPELLSIEGLEPFQKDAINKEFEIKSLKNLPSFDGIPKGDRIYIDFSTGRFVFTTATLLNVSKHYGTITKDGTVSEVESRVVLCISPMR